jgi:hypothetical protein
MAIKISRSVIILKFIARSKNGIKIMQIDRSINFQCVITAAAGSFDGIVSNGFI